MADRICVTSLILASIPRRNGHVSLASLLLSPLTSMVTVFVVSPGTKVSVPVLAAPAGGTRDTMWWVRGPAGACLAVRTPPADFLVPVRGRAGKGHTGKSRAPLFSREPPYFRLT